MDHSSWFDANALAVYESCNAEAAANTAVMLHAQFDLWPLFSSDTETRDEDSIERHERMLPVHWKMNQNDAINGSTTQEIPANDPVTQDAGFERCFYRPLAQKDHKEAVSELQILPHCGVAFIRTAQNPTVGMLSSWYKRWLVLDCVLGALVIYKHNNQQTQCGALELCTVSEIKRTSRLELTIDFTNAAQSSLLLRCQSPSQTELWTTVLHLAQQLIMQSQNLNPELTTLTNAEDFVSQQLMKLQLETVLR